MRIPALLALAALAGACHFEDVVGGTRMGRVGAPCDSDSVCRNGLACVARRCAAKADRAEGGACVITDECAEGLYCSFAMKCEKAGAAASAGESCGSPGGCDRGLACLLDGLSGTCAPQGGGDLGVACEAHGDCLAGLMCLDGRCQPPAQFASRLREESCPSNSTLAPPFRVHFEVPRGGQRLADFYRLPYPNDLRRRDGRLAIGDHPTPGPGFLGVDVVKQYVDASAELDGFGTNAAVFFRFSGPIDFESLDGALEWVDLTDGSKLGYAYNYREGRGRYICQNALALRPPAGNPLRGGRTYAVLVKRSVKGEGGEALEVDADFAALLGADAPADPDLARAHAAYAPLREYLEKQAIAPDTLAAATVFTTHDPLRAMRRMREAVRAAPAPVVEDVTVCGAGVVSPCAAEGAPGRECGADQADFTEIHARVSIPVFQQGTAPYLTEGGRIELEPDGLPKVARLEKVCAAITVPKGGAMPARGWPAVVYAHGTGGSFRSHVLDGTAQSLSAAGTGSGDPVRFAVIGFDQIQHAARRGGSTKAPDELVFNFRNPHAARDNFLQGAADAMTFARLASSLDLAAGGTAVRVDPAQLHYFGHSQGGTTGPIALAFEDAYRTAVLSGAGGLLVESLLGKRSPIDIAGLMQLALADTSALTPSHPVLNVFQAWFEASDPVNYGRLVTVAPPEGLRFKHVLQTYGLGETFTPAKTMQALGLSMGLVLANEPPLEEFGMRAAAPPLRGHARSGAQTAALQQYQPDGYDGHFVVFRHPDAKRRVAAFLASAVRDPEGVPTLAP